MTSFFEKVYTHARRTSFLYIKTDKFYFLDFTRSYEFAS